ncbi:MAG: S41 family peptidase [Candidatus Woesearchaeota archaeon]
MQKKYIKKLIIIALSFVLVFGVAQGVMAQELETKEDDEYDSFKKFQEVLFYLKNYHVDEMGYDKILEGAIDGMLQEADPYSYYLTPDEYEEMQVEFEGHFGGIGIRILTVEGELTIVSPIKGTPGDKAGLQAKDVITHIEGEPTSEMTQKEAVDIMRGEPGTEVNITVRREGEDSPLEFNIEREDIEIPYVSSEMKNDNIAYISVTEFAEDVGLKVRKAITNLKGKGAEAVILDLRSNPGGILTEAINVSSNFIEEGTIVSAKQRDGESEIYEASSEIASVDLPLAVLINGGSASASEIVSAAIRDYDRGTLVGSRTFGKGTVQRVIPLKDESAIKMTIARYYTPDEEFIHEKGIEPDVKVEYNPESEEDKQLNKAIEILEEKINKDEMKKAS